MNHETEQLNEYLENVLRIENKQVRVALNREGLDRIKSFLDVSERTLETICKNLRKPGGWIPHPNFVNLVDSDDEEDEEEAAYRATSEDVRDRRNSSTSRLAPDPGVFVPEFQVTRLKKLRYYVHHLELVQKEWNPVKATLDALEDCWKFKKYLESSMSPSNNGSYSHTGNDFLLSRVTRLTNISCIAQMKAVKEDIDHYLHTKRGASGVRLAYVVRERAQVEDEMFEGEMLEGENILLSMDDEMVRRAAHEGSSYRHDNEMVWHCLRHAIRDGPAWSWISLYSESMDGRSAYLSLQANCFNQAFRERIRRNAETILQHARYHPDGKYMTNFSSFCAKLNRAFRDLEKYATPISMERKVRYLEDSVRGWEGITEVLYSKPELRNDFEKSCQVIALVDARLSKKRRPPQGGTSGCRRGDGWRSKRARYR